NGVLEVRPEAAIVPFAEPGLLGVHGVVEVGGRIAFAAQDEGHGVPREVDRPPAGLRIPVASLPAAARAIGANGDRPPGGQGILVVVGADLEPGVLRIAVDAYRT